MQYRLPCIYRLDTTKEDKFSGAETHFVFVFLLLWPRVATLSKIPANALRVRLARPLILCIEDEPIQLLIRKKVLEQDGYAVIGVTTAEEAIKVLKDAPVCAVIADHMLQGTTGVGLAKEMKKIKPDVPTILFSGNPPQHLKGVDVFVNKGEPTATFLGIVREVVERFCS